MFTGLVEDVGRLAGSRRRGAGRLLVVSTSLPMSELAPGDSIAVDGACLTVESTGAGAFEVLAGPETIRRTTLGRRPTGCPLHLERALRLDGRLGGHLVLGHVDGLGRVLGTRGDSARMSLWIEVPEELRGYVAPKGSIAIDGVSLTVNELRGSSFRVDLVPFTLGRTHLGSARPGSQLNIEVDILARYLERLLAAGEQGLSFERLRELGFGPRRTGPG